MQQLIGEKAVTTEGSVIKDLFMQRLPTNVSMVLAAAREKTSLEELAQLADKIIEVALPSFATVATPPQETSEVDSLRAEKASLRNHISVLQVAIGPIDGEDHAVRITEADLVPPRTRGPVGTTVCSEIPL